MLATPARLPTLTTPESKKFIEKTNCSDNVTNYFNTANSMYFNFKLGVFQPS